MSTYGKATWRLENELAAVGHFIVMCEERRDDAGVERHKADMRTLVIELAKRYKKESK